MPKMSHRIPRFFPSPVHFLHVRKSEVRWLDARIKAGPVPLNSTKNIMYI